MSFELPQNNSGKSAIEKHREAAQKLNEFGLLSMTAQDHEDIGSTPDQIQIDNPNKTLAELMTDGEILDYLKADFKFIDGSSDIPAAVRYLKSINRLPPSFEIKE